MTEDEKMDAEAVLLLEETLRECLAKSMAYKELEGLELEGLKAEELVALARALAPERSREFRICIKEGKVAVIFSEPTLAILADPDEALKMAKHLRYCAKALLVEKN